MQGQFLGALQDLFDASAIAYLLKGLADGGRASDAGPLWIRAAAQLRTQAFQDCGRSQLGLSSSRKRPSGRRALAAALAGCTLMHSHPWPGVQLLLAPLFAASCQKQKRCPVVRRFWDLFMVQQTAALQSGLRQAPLPPVPWSGGGLVQMQLLRFHTKVEYGAMCR